MKPRRNDGRRRQRRRGPSVPVGTAQGNGTASLSPFRLVLFVVTAVCCLAAFSDAHMLRSSSAWPSEGSLTIDELTIVSEFDQITILGDVNVVKKGILVIEGDSASLFALDMHIAGLVNFVFSNDGPAEAVNIEGDLVVATSAKLSIDASDYSAGEGVVHLMRYTAHTGTFAPRNVMVIGLDPSLSAEIVDGPDSLDMIVTHNPAYRRPAADKRSDGRHNDSNTGSSPDDRFHTMFKQASHQETNHRFHLLHHLDDSATA